MYYIYMLRCEDDSIYTGITTDLNRRMNEHFSKCEKCAKYTYRHTAKRLEMAWQTENRVLASKLEYHIKHLKKFQKEELINKDCNIEKFLSDKIECDKYLSLKEKLNIYFENKIEKKLLREKYKKIRNLVKNKDLKSKKIFDKIYFLSEFKNSKVIGIYSGFKDEVNTFNFINEVLKDNEISKKIVVVPKVIDNDKLKFYKINSIDDLKCIGSFGIGEPEENDMNYIFGNKIDFMIIPGICFDINKNRVGFGKGYYDKYLSNQKNIFKVGICYDEQVLNNDYIDIDENDIKMDIIVTDKRIL